MRLNSLLPVGAALVAGVAAVPAFADPISPGGTAVYTVGGTASVYQVFGHSGSPGGGGSSADAVLTTFAANNGAVFSFNATGLVNCCGGTPNTGPDGFTQQTAIQTANGLSGLAGNAGAPLVGVFTSNTDPFNGVAPASLTFDAASPMGLSPLLNQVFYIGDGHAGFNNAAGAMLQFVAPQNASRLYIGLLDAGNFSGQPGHYADNTGSFTVNVSLANTAGAVPEAATWAMMILGMGAIGTAMRRRKVTMRVSYAA